MSDAQTKTASDANTNQAAEDAKSKAEEFAGMVASKTASAMKDEFGALGKTMSEGFDKLIGALTQKSSEPEIDDETAEFAADMERSAAEWEKKAAVGTLQKRADTHPSQESVLGGSDKSGKVRTIPGVERYSHVKTACVWGRSVGDDADKVIRKDRNAYYMDGKSARHRYLDQPTQRDDMVCSVWVRAEHARHGLTSLNEHEIEIFKWTLRNETFVVDPGPDGHGFARECVRRKLTEMEISDIEHRMLSKATVIIDDSTSGGAHAVPEVYDDAIIRTPLLHSQLFPHVRVITLGKGAALEGAIIGTPTFSSTASGTAITPITTDSFVSDFTIPIYPASCAVQFGLDFLGDALPTFFAAVRDQIAQEGIRWLDEQIAIGDGTTEPQGIMTASGTAVASANGTGGAMTIADAINMIFGITKPHRDNFGGVHTGYVMNDTTYKNFRNIQTGISGDVRLALSSEIKDYEMFGYPVWIQNDMTTGNIAFVNLMGYRLVRRQGLQFVTDESGSTLRLANARLLLGRMRWGGKLELTGYVGQMTDGDVT